LKTKNPDAMKTKPFSTMGALHPVLFFVVVYGVALLFSIFICSSLFYSCKSNSNVADEQNMPIQKDNSATVATTVAMH